MDELSFEQRWADAEREIKTEGDQKSDPFTAVVVLLNTALSLWLSKEKTKYVDKLNSLKKDYYEEESKPRPSRATLDNIRIELRVLQSAFVAAAKAPNV